MFERKIIKRNDFFSIFEHRQERNYKTFFKQKYVQKCLYMSCSNLYEFNDYQETSGVSD